jgi:hypothetical protein
MPLHLHIALFHPAELPSHAVKQNICLFRSFCYFLFENLRKRSRAI